MVPEMEVVSGRVLLILKDGTSRELIGSTRMSAAGAFLMLNAAVPISMEQIASAEILIQAPVVVGRTAASEGAPPALAWLGR
jgi:hypothetical protein